MTHRTFTWLKVSDLTATRNGLPTYLFMTTPAGLAISPDGDEDVTPVSTSMSTVGMIEPGGISGAKSGKHGHSKAFLTVRQFGTGRRTEHVVPQYHYVAVLNPRRYTGVVLDVENSDGSSAAALWRTGRKGGGDNHHQIIGTERLLVMRESGNCGTSRSADANDVVNDAGGQQQELCVPASLDTLEQAMKGCAASEVPAAALVEFSVNGAWRMVGALRIMPLDAPSTTITTTTAAAAAAGTEAATSADVKALVVATAANGDPNDAFGGRVPRC